MIIALIVVLAAGIALATARFPIPDPSVWADEQARPAKLR